jgi:hypothetical protein
MYNWHYENKWFATAKTMKASLFSHSCDLLVFCSLVKQHFLCPRWQKNCHQTKLHPQYHPYTILLLFNQIYCSHNAKTGGSQRSINMQRLENTLIITIIITIKSKVHKFCPKSRYLISIWAAYKGRMADTISSDKSK